MNFIIENLLLFVMEVYKKDVSAGTVLGDLEKIHDALEAALPRHRPGDVRQFNGHDGSDNDVTVTHAIAPPLF
jgi:hypothetical protein